MLKIRSKIRSKDNVSANSFGVYGNRCLSSEKLCVSRLEIVGQIVGRRLEANPREEY